MSGMVGTLSVYIRVNLEGGELIKPPVWWRMNNYGNTWRQGEIDIPQSVYPLLEVRGNDYQISKQLQLKKT